MLVPFRWKLVIASVVAGGFVLTLVLGGGGQPGEPKPPSEAKPVPKPFDELTVTLKTGAFNQELSAAITITPEGQCVYEVAGRPTDCSSSAWPAAKVAHTLPPERLEQLVQLLKATDWLGKEPAKGPSQLGFNDYTLNLTREGKPSTAVCRGEQATYAELTTFLFALNSQELLRYLVETLPDRVYSTGARNILDSYLRAELGTPFASRPTFPLDYTRFVAWATALVRKPEGKSADDLRTAVRLVAHLRLETERKTLVELTKHTDGYVRRAAGDALDWMSPEAVKLAKTLAEYRVKMPPAEGFHEQEGRSMNGSDFTMPHLAGVAKRLKATTRGEALVLFAHLHVEPSVDVRYIAAKALDGIYKYRQGFVVTAFTDVKSLEHRQMLVDFQAALDASGK